MRQLWQSIRRLPRLIPKFLASREALSPTMQRYIRSADALVHLALAFFFGGVVMLALAHLPVMALCLTLGSLIAMVWRTVRFLSDAHPYVHRGDAPENVAACRHVVAQYVWHIWLMVLMWLLLVK